jgi:hypothetical protein
LLLKVARILSAWDGLHNHAQTAQTVCYLTFTMFPNVTCTIGWAGWLVHQKGWGDRHHTLTNIASAAVYILLMDFRLLIGFTIYLLPVPDVSLLVSSWLVSYKKNRSSPNPTHANKVFWVARILIYIDGTGCFQADRSLSASSMLNVLRHFQMSIQLVHQRLSGLSRCADKVVTFKIALRFFSPVMDFFN